MSLVVNHNLMAANTARNLNAHYGRLATSTQRLSSGLRINSAADDAAGLAIRELQRADIAALQQGARNANDAISMIQVADGALGIIDEKLIRMKELAEQAATGTYDSTQRLMIESEYQAMASEITRIANATDFNGMKLLDGTLDGEHDGSKMTATGKMKIHFGTGNDSAEDYYYITAGECTAQAFGVGNASGWDDAMERTVQAFKNSLSAQIKDVDEPNQTKLKIEMENAVKDFEAALKKASSPDNERLAKFNGVYSDGDAYTPNPYDGEAKDWPTNMKFPVDMDEYNALTTNQQQKVQYALGKAALYNYANESYPNYKLNDIDGELDATDFRNIPGGSHIYDNALKAANEYAQSKNAAGMTVETQEDAQMALEAINDAIVSKDKIRAHLGAVQNRLENTVSNLNIQAENLQAAESRISDVDVATEMTQFVRNQILTQSAVAMLGQANSLPQMAMQLIGG